MLHQVAGGVTGQATEIEITAKTDTQDKREDKTVF